METFIIQTDELQAVSTYDECIRSCERCPRIFYSRTPQILCERCLRNAECDASQESDEIAPV